MNLDRRFFVSSAGLLGIGGMLEAVAAKTSPGAASPAIAGPYLDLRKPRDNMLAYARLQGNLDTAKTKYLWFSGNVIGYRGNEKARDLFRVEGMSSCRLEPLENGGYMRLLREVGYYIDPQTGEVMDEWRNVYTNEIVPVVHIFNDPFNYKIEEFYPDPPSFGGQNREKPPRVPFILPWQQNGPNLNLDLHIHLHYPSPLSPAKWPREAHGPMTRVSEIFMNQIQAADMQNPVLTSVTHTGSWIRVTPWLPWMLMDQSSGHVMYTCFKGTGDSIDVVPERIRTAAERRHPSVFTAPEKFTEPSLSSLENYARQQKPSPAR